jgi:hypothetical protein
MLRFLFQLLICSLNNFTKTQLDETGLKRTGKSCRLRWLNYLRPDVRRGNITLEEQLMILELHSRWGNRYAILTTHALIILISKCHLITRMFLLLLITFNFSRNK